MEGKEEVSEGGEEIEQTKNFLRLVSSGIYIFIDKGTSHN